MKVQSALFSTYEACLYTQALGELLAKKLKAEGKSPYVIPVGGSNSLGTWYAVLRQQIQNGWLKI